MVIGLTQHDFFFKLNPKNTGCLLFHKLNAKHPVAHIECSCPCAIVCVYNAFSYWLRTI